MTQKTQDQEIDLGQIGKGISNFYQGIIATIFDFIFFIKKKIIIFGLLVVFGFALGYYLDKTKVYTTEIQVIPNFGTNDYLYKRVAHLEAKLKERDTSFFNNLGIKNVKKIIDIDITPINGIYSYINSSDENNKNFDLVKLMAEDGDIQKIINDKVTSKNYPQHNITIVTTRAFSKKELVDPILNYLQQSDYYTKLKVIFNRNLVEKIKANDILINQIDQLLASYANNPVSGGVMISENGGIADVIAKKDELLNENNFHQIQLLESTKIIKDQEVTLNKMDSEGLANKMKFIVPIVFLVLYLVGYRFQKQYQTQKLRKQAE